MSTSTFQFQRFTISQDRTAMKVGTDGVLLGAWAPVAGARRILDIGTGTGLIALMAAQRNPEAHIDALEIDADAAAQARDNVAASPWADRIQVLQADFLDYAQSYAAALQEEAAAPYDVILSNPPFFTETFQSPDARRAAARHAASSLPFERLLSGAASLLAPAGVLALIYPYATDGEVQTAAIRARLYCSDLCTVCTTPTKPPKRLMALFRPSAPDYGFRRSTLPIHAAGGAYSEEYRRLTQEFYLKLGE
jgi:tRNA1Val (adenine37-N6)-methyltransferase